MTKKRIKIAAFALCAITALTIPLSGCSERSKYKWARKVIDQYYYVDIDSDAKFNGSVKDFVSKYLDIYSAYYTASEYSSIIASNSGQKSGVGLSYMYVPEGVHPQGISGVLVESVVGNSNAYYSGLKEGEIITSASMDGEVTYFTSSNEFSSYLTAIKDGKNFTLHCDRHSGGHELSKSAYMASYCYMVTNETTYSVVYSDNKESSLRITKGAVGIPALPEGAAYLKLDQFYGKAADELAELIKIYNTLGCTSLILDLRGNGGGYVSVMQDIADVFVGSLSQPYKNAMYAVYKDGSREAYPVSNKFGADSRLAAGTTVNVLADNGTASASEALLGVLIDNGVIDYSNVYLSDFSEGYLTLTGTSSKNCRTYGKGIMQTTFVKKITGDALKLTTARIFWPKGDTCIHDIGLTEADGCKTVKTDWDVTYGDEQLDKIIALIYKNQS